MTYEQAIKELEEIVNEMKEENLPLEQMMTLFQKGIERTKFCENYLKETKLKMITLQEELTQKGETE